MKKTWISFLTSLLAPALLACTALHCGGDDTTDTQSIAAPIVPDAIKAPAGETVLVRYKASGAQVYTCTQDAMTQAYAWTLKGPDAVLHDYDSGQNMGTHSVGPTWTSSDGSSVIGMV